MFIGSFGELWITPAPAFKESAMTALGVHGTEHGLIMGADGRKRVDDASRGKNPELASHDSVEAQKIFPIVGPDMVLAYAIAGNVIGDTPPFDSLKECATLAERAKTQNYQDAKRLVNRFCKGLTDAINRVGHFPQINQNQDGSWKVVDLLFAGYFRSIPFVIYAEINHSGKLAEFYSHSMSPQGLLYGSGVVRQKMYDDFGNPVRNSPFAEFIQDPQQIGSLNESEKYVRGYIEACSTELALSMDEAHCKKIGGHIHIAEITLDGFRWRIPPIQTEQKPAA